MNAVEQVAGNAGASEEMRQQRIQAARDFKLQLKFVCEELAMQADANGDYPLDPESDLGKSANDIMERLSKEEFENPLDMYGVVTPPLGLILVQLHKEGSITSDQKYCLMIVLVHTMARAMA